LAPASAPARRTAARFRPFPMAPAGIKNLSRGGGDISGCGPGPSYSTLKARAFRFCPTPGRGERGRGRGWNRRRVLSIGAGDGVGRSGGPGGSFVADVRPTGGLIADGRGGGGKRGFRCRVRQQRPHVCKVFENGSGGTYRTAGTRAGLFLPAQPPTPQRVSTDDRLPAGQVLFHGDRIALVGHRSQVAATGRWGWPGRVRGIRQRLLTRRTTVDDADVARLTHAQARKKTRGWRQKEPPGGRGRSSSCALRGAKPVPAESRRFQAASNRWGARRCGRDGGIRCPRRERGRDGFRNNRDCGLATHGAWGGRPRLPRDSGTFHRGRHRALARQSQSFVPGSTNQSLVGARACSDVAAKRRKGPVVPQGGILCSVEVIAV